MSLDHLSLTSARELFLLFYAFSHSFSKKSSICRLPSFLAQFAQCWTTWLFSHSPKTKKHTSPYSSSTFWYASLTLVFGLLLTLRRQPTLHSFRLKRSKQGQKHRFWAPRQMHKTKRLHCPPSEWCPAQPPQKSIPSGDSKQTGKACRELRLVWTRSPSFLWPSQWTRRALPGQPL